MSNNFLERLNEKIQSAKKIPAEPKETFDEVKKKLISIIQEDFLNSIPDEIVEGKEIMLDSRWIRIENKSEKEYCIMIGNEIIQNYKCNHHDYYERARFLSNLEKQIVSELSHLIGRRVVSVCSSDSLHFFCYY